MNLITQLGYHFFEDTKHYTRAKLEDWYSSVGRKAQWICLKSSCTTAIPEVVLLFCQENQIKPIIQFELNEWQKASPQEFITLLQYYKKKNIEFIQLDGYFNQRSTWTSTEPVGDILSVISNTVLEFQKLAEEYEFYHVLPKLLTGGDYWDLVVLKYILQQLHQSEADQEILVLSFAAWFRGHPLLWGKGGKSKWTEPQPYIEKFNGEDHRGFMGFQWYQEAASEEFGRELPILVLEAGQDIIKGEGEESQNTLKELVEFLGNEGNANSFSKVLGVCLAYEESVFSKNLSAYLSSTIEYSQVNTNFIVEKSRQEKPFLQAAKWMPKRKNEKNITHYLLLPEYEWGISPWHLEVSLPFIRKYRPTVGYALEEAKNATFVTVVMDDDVFTDEHIEILRSAGCKVALINGDGTEIAAKLAAE